MKILNKVKKFLLLICMCGTAYANVKLDIEIHGIQAGLLSNATASLSLLQDDITKNLKQQDIQQYYEQGAQEIINALKPFGYYHASITKTLRKHSNKTSIDYYVKKGPAIQIKSIKLDWQASPNTASEVYQRYKAFPLKVGQRLLQPVYQNHKQKILEYCLAHGFFDAKFTQSRIEIDLMQNQAEIIMALKPGAQYHYGKITFKQDSYSPTFLERFLIIQTEQEYQLSQLEKQQELLSEADFFSSVEINPLFEQKNDQQIPVDIILEPRSKYKLETGLGYGTDTGIRGILGVEFRRITNYAHSLRNINRISENNEQYILEYNIPGKHPSIENYQIVAAYIDDKPPERNLESITQKLSFGHLIGDIDAKQKRLYQVSIEHEAYQNIDKKLTSTLVLPSITQQWTNTDDRFDTKYGHSFQMELRGASEAILSSTNFLQSIFSGKYITSIGENWRILSRAKLGLSFKESLADIPPSLRFFAGGDHSVRGYAYQSLSPTRRNSRGKIINIGASHLIETSLELERKLWGKWRAAVFYDMGNAVEKLDHTLKHGAGIGLRWQSPIGLVRLDAAFALSSDGDPLRIHVSVGPDL